MKALSASRKNMQRLIRNDRARTPWLCAIFLLFSWIVLRLILPTTCTDHPEPPIITHEDPVWVGIFGGELVNGVPSISAAGVMEKELWQWIEPWLAAADYSCIQLGGPIAGRHLGAGKNPSFNPLDREIPRVLADVGINVVSLANPNALEAGGEGLLDTLGALAFHRVGYTGAGGNLAEASRFHLHDDGRLRVATLGFNTINTGETAAGEHHPGVMPASGSYFAPLLRQARMQADLIIVHLYLGSGGNGQIAGKDEDLAKAMIDSGADIVIGHGRRIKPVEVYNGGVIFYSLGVLAGAQGTSREKETVLVQYALGDDGMAEIRLIPLYNHAGVPHPLTGFLARYHHWQIRQALTGRLVDWDTDADGHLIFSLDHSHVLKGGK